MKKRFGVLGLLLLVLSASGMGGASATSAKLDFHVADAFIANATGTAQSGARAQAANGDIVSVTATGTFNVASEKTTGGGTFVHTTSAGVLKGSGTWTATGVQSFTPFGCGIAGTTPLPPNFCGGVLVLSVHLVGAGGSPQFDATLNVSCAIGAGAPPGSPDSITLNVPDAGINFNSPILASSGLTLYVSRSKNPAP